MLDNRSLNLVKYCRTQCLYPQCYAVFLMNCYPLDALCWNCPLPPKTEGFDCFDWIIQGRSSCIGTSPNVSFRLSLCCLIFFPFSLLDKCPQSWILWSTKRWLDINVNSNVQISVYLNQFVLETSPSKRLSASSLCAAEVTVIQKNWRREEIFIFHWCTSSYFPPKDTVV